MFVIKKQHL